MSHAVRGGLAVLALVSAFGLAACGGTIIDEGKAEDAVQNLVQKNTNTPVESVDCPSDVDVEAGKTFDCEVVAESGEKATATVKIENEDADITVIDFKQK